MFKLIGIWMFEWLWCLSNLIIKPRMLSYDKGFKREVRCRKFDEQAYQTMIKKTIDIKSDFGYIISCELLDPNQERVESEKKKDINVRSTNSKDEIKIAILCHGLGYAKYGSIKYVGIFLKLGFKVVIYDHRNHGLSGKAHTSMGYYEKYDLKKVIDWCYDYYGANCKIVTHGESMGAATVLLHLGIDDRVKCVIADCAYSDLRLLLRHQLKQYYHLPNFLIPIESCITYLRAGFWFREVSPIKIVSNTNTPILFIHGKIDNLVPADMSKQMYSCKKNNRAIYLVAGARHADCYCANPTGYEQRVDEFLKSFLY